MTEVINQFFETYPDAPCVHEVAGQLFHDNAKGAAEARAKFYGLEVVTHTKGVTNNEQGLTIDEVVTPVDTEGGEEKTPEESNPNKGEGIAPLEPVTEVEAPKGKKGKK